MRRGAVVDADAALFVGCALTNALGVAGLIRVFGYPGMLNDPAGATLAALGARSWTLTLFALLTAGSAVLLVPLTTRIVRFETARGTGRRAEHANRAGWVLLCTGLATSTIMIFEWSFWIIGVPLLARHPAGPGPISHAVTTFDALRVTLGVLCGETLGPLLLAGWTVLVASHFVASVFDDWWPVAAARPAAPARQAVPAAPAASLREGLLGHGGATVAAAADWLRLQILRWARPVLVGSGLACAALLFAGAAAAAGLVPAPPRLPAVARMLWSLWLAGIGAVVWVSRVRAADGRRGAGHRRVAPGLPWRITGPRAAVRPRAFENTPFRYTAYRAARSRALLRPRPGTHGAGPGALRARVGGRAATGGHDAVTEAGDEAILDPAPHARGAGADDGADPPTELVAARPRREIHPADDDAPTDPGPARG